MSRYRYMFMYSSGCLIELAKFVVAFVIFGVLLHLIVVTILPISGSSMAENFQSGEWIVLDKISYIAGRPARGDVVALKFPGDPNKVRYIKRVIGLPGETVEIKSGKVYVNGDELQELYIPADVITDPHSSNFKWTMQKDEYFLLGDNRYNSSDSRDWNVAKKTDIIGRAKYVIFPLKRIKPVNKAVY